MKEWICEEVPAVTVDGKVVSTMLHQLQELVRCKDCKYRGKSEKCVLSAISEEKDYPLFMLDNRGEWFCADGKPKNKQLDYADKDTAYYADTPTIMPAT